MNARQKAKKYKRMYEELLNRHQPKFKVEEHKIDILKFEQYYPTKLLATQKNNTYLRETIVKNIAQDLASNLDEYVDYNMKFCSDINKYCFSGTIKVVDRVNIQQEE